MLVSKNLIKSLALTFFVILFFLLMIDVSARFFLPQYNEIIEYDDRYLHKLMPNSEKIHVMAEEDGSGRNLVKINSFGFRNEEFKQLKEQKRIIVYGDSFIEAEFSQLENTFSKQLEKKLNLESEEPVEVINGGVIAYGMDQISLKLEDELDIFNPDLVIVSVFPANDFGDNIRNKIFRLDSENQLIENDYFLNPELKKKKKLASFFPSLRLYFRAFNNFRQFIGPSKVDSGNSTLLSQINDCEDFIVKKNNQVNNLFNDRPEIDMLVNPDGYCALYKIKLMEEIIKRMKSLADSKNVVFVLMIMPSKEDLNKSSTLLTDVLVEISEKNNISYLDLSQEFDTSFYFVRDGHWNSKGQELAAESMKKQLIKLN
tara:strand:+ start:19181 stop:20296 length:1116 start_codon:yes stop_codon:yes gene_type:complete